MSLEPTQVVPDEQDCASLSSSSSGGCSNEEGGFSPPPLVRAHAVAGKRPRGVLFEDEDDVLEETVDLGVYFAQFGLSHASQIALCRTYANYLAALTRPKEYNVRKK